MKYYQLTGIMNASSLALALNDREVALAVDNELNADHIVHVRVLSGTVESTVSDWTGDSVTFLSPKAKDIIDLIDADRVQTLRCHCDEPSLVHHNIFLLHVWNLFDVINPELSEIEYSRRGRIICIDKLVLALNKVNALPQNRPLIFKPVDAYAHTIANDLAYQIITNASLTGLHITELAIK